MILPSCTGGLPAQETAPEPGYDGNKILENDQPQVEPDIPPVGGTPSTGLLPRLDPDELNLEQTDSFDEHSPDDGHQHGTDSAAVVPGEMPDPDLVQSLSRLGQLYLEYDYRQAPGEVLTEMEPLTTPDLLSALAQPLPAALVQTLVEQQHTVTAELESFDVIEHNTFRLAYSVTESDGAGQPPQTTTARRVLVISVNDQGQAVDIR